MLTPGPQRVRSPAVTADDEPAPRGGAEPCSACRGTGQVISALGGERQALPCPWCDGGGVRLAGHDAQARHGADAPVDADDPGGGGDAA